MVVVVIRGGVDAEIDKSVLVGVVVVVVIVVVVVVVDFVVVVVAGGSTGINGDVEAGGRFPAAVGLEACP